MDKITSHEDTALLRIKNLTVQYVTADGTVQAVDDLNLTLQKGETLGLVGETGAGKTTAVKAIMRILAEPPAKIASGEIVFSGRDLLHLSNREMRKIRGKQISMIFQDPMTSLNPVMTVRSQIVEAIGLHSELSHREAIMQADKMLELAGIRSERGNDYPHQFSGGMKQRVVIAMALACNPKLLIADEPTTALDVTIQAQVLELMKKLKQVSDMSMIIITHDLGIVAEICDRIAIMYAGQIVEIGPLEALFHRPSHPYTKGLFACIPNILDDNRALIPIHGLPPDPTRLPQGCRFAPRCSHSHNDCGLQNPSMQKIEAEHFVRCPYFKEN